MKFVINIAAMNIHIQQTVEVRCIQGIDSDGV